MSTDQDTITPLRRSRYANRRRIPGVDSRSAEGRQLATLIDGLAQPFGGREALSERQWALVQQLAVLEIELAKMRGDIVNASFGADCNALLRLNTEARRLEAELYGNARARLGSDKTPAAA
jgi:hypothetical protein